MMKIGYGFVSNSSSCSFIIRCDNKTEIDDNEMKDILFKDEISDNDKNEYLRTIKFYDLDLSTLYDMVNDGDYTFDLDDFDAILTSEYCIKYLYKHTLSEFVENHIILFSSFYYQSNINLYNVIKQKIVTISS